MTATEVVWALIVVLIATLPICSLLGGRFDYEDDRNHDDRRDGAP